jgi:NAD(P)-dependent dehydrogenase (short-subunit alcohol dehydrogenase family)
VASTAAFQPLPGQAGYSASKAFVLAYSRAVHLRQLVGKRPQPVLATSDQGHAVAALGQLPGELVTDAGRGSGDERGAVRCRRGKRHRARNVLCAA